MDVDKVVDDPLVNLRRGARLVSISDLRVCSVVGELSDEPEVSDHVVKLRRRQTAKGATSEPNPKDSVVGKLISLAGRPGSLLWRVRHPGAHRVRGGGSGVLAVSSSATQPAPNSSSPPTNQASSPSATSRGVVRASETGIAASETTTHAMLAPQFHLQIAAETECPDTHALEQDRYP